MYIVKTHTTHVGHEQWFKVCTVGEVYITSVTGCIIQVDDQYDLRRLSNNGFQVIQSVKCISLSTASYVFMLT